MKIYAGSDHAGLDLKDALCKQLVAEGHDVVDLGCNSEEVTDYPDWAARVSRAVRGDEAAKGLIVCGSGVGVSIVANKIPGIRAVDAWNVESARLAREHNDTNVLCLGQRMVSPEDAQAIVQAWLGADFEHGRHVRRLVKIAALESAEAIEVAIRRELALMLRNRTASTVADHPPAWLAPSLTTAAAGLRADAVDNPALELAAFIVAATNLGRNQLTVLAPAECQALLLRLDQLTGLAAGFSQRVRLHLIDPATAKADSWADPASWNDDRAFVLVSVATSRFEIRAVDALLMAGHPIKEIIVPGPGALGAEILRWEFAIAAAIARLGAAQAETPGAKPTG